MYYRIPALLMMIVLVPSLVMARPVTYPGGISIMSMNDANMKSQMIHYTVQPDYALGYKVDFIRGDEKQMHTATIANLLKRFNNPGSQANLWLKSGVGFAEDDGDYEPAVFTGFSADWENRRFYVSYENRAIDAADIDRSYMQNARIGITPYIGSYGDLHTWLMVQADHYPGGDKDGENFTVTPMVRLFKDRYLGEFGVNNNGEVLINLSTYF